MRARVREAPKAADRAAEAGFRWREHLGPLLLMAAVAAGVAVFFLAIYKVRHYPMPIGWDTPRYLSQTNFVAERGLTSVPHALPPPSKTLTSRAGFPVMVLSLSSLFGVSTFKTAAIVPAVAAVAIALAAGALVSASLRRPAWEAAVVAVLVGLSPVVVRLFAPETYTDNLLAAAMFVGAMVPLMLAVRYGEGFLAAILLLGAGGLAHSPFFAVMVAVLGVLFVLYLPASWRMWRGREADTGLLDTPSARVGMVAAGGALLAGAGIYGLLRTSPDTPKLSRGELSKKLREDLPLYLFPVTAPLAAAGLGALALQARRHGDPAADGETSRRAAGFLFRLLLAWGVVVTAGVAAYLIGMNVPAHRFLAFLVPLPVLVALFLLWGSRRMRGRGRRPVGAAVVLAGIAGMAALGTYDLYVNLPEQRGIEWLELNKVQDTRTAVAYLDAARVPAGAPVVFVVDDTGTNPLSYVPEMGYMIRAVLPPDREQHSHFYVGDPERYLAGQPTYRSRPKSYNVNSNRFWKPLRPLLAEHPVALMLRSFNPSYKQVVAEHPDWVVGPNVVVLAGPRPASPVPAPPYPSGPRTLVQGVGLGGGTLVVLGLIGLGWALALLPRRLRSFEVLAMSLSFGLGFLLLVGVVVDAVGVRLSGAGGVVAVALTGISGWAVALARVGWRPAACLRHFPPG